MVSEKTSTLFKTAQSESGEGASLAVQWLRIHASNPGGAGSIPGQRSNIPHAAQCGQKK